MTQIKTIGSIDKLIDILKDADDKDLLIKVLSSMMLGAKERRLSDNRIKQSGNVAYLLKEGYREWVK